MKLSYYICLYKVINGFYNIKTNSVIKILSKNEDFKIIF